MNSFIAECILLSKQFYKENELSSVSRHKTVPVQCRYHTLIATVDLICKKIDSLQSVITQTVSLERTHRSYYLSGHTFRSRLTNFLSRSSSLVTFSVR